MLFSPVLFFNVLLSSALALPLDSYGRYHEYGKYGGPYGDYPGFPPAEHKKADARQITVSPFGGGF